MSKKTIVTILTITLARASFACDICGCNMSGLYFGFLPMYNTHFVGLRYSQASFSAFIDNDDFYFEDEFSEDRYQRVELIGRLSLSKKFQFRYIVPYMMNRMDGSHQSVNSSGVGDPIAMIYYAPINTGNDFTREVMHSLMLGGGLKFPVGQFEKQDNGQLVNRNFQLGSGSLDYLLAINYTARYKTIGINSEASYKFNTENEDNYRFGDQFNISANFFYYMEMPKLSILPFAGIYYERAELHKSNNIIEANTGGSALLGTVGLQLFRNKLTMNMQYQVPISQSFNTDDFASIEGKNRFSIGVIRSFAFGKRTEQ
ncbi:transporter family protein [Ekhidna sp.]